MRLYRNLPIKWKLMSIITLTTGGALLLAWATFIGFESVQLEREAAAELATLAEMTGANTTAPLSFEDREAAGETLRALRAERQIVEACVYDREGHFFAGYARDGARLAFPEKPQAPGHYFERNGLNLFQQIKLDGEEIGSIYLRSDREKINSRLRRNSLILGLVTLASCLLAILFSSRLQGVVSEPIRHLSETARLVSFDANFGVRATKRNNDELGVLTDTFNEMLDPDSGAGPGTGPPR